MRSKWIEILEFLEVPGDPKLALEILKECPDLSVDVVPVKDEQGLTVLLRSIYNLASTENPETRTHYIKLINYLIDQKKFDITDSDKDGNTALQLIFWYAIKSGSNTRFRDEFISIGKKLIECIEDPKSFMAVLSQENKLGETFLATINITNLNILATLSNEQKSNMVEVQKVVLPLLQKFEKNPEEVDVVYDFTKRSFTDYLEAILNDPTSRKTMEFPVLFESGHSLSYEQWEKSVENNKSSNKPILNLYNMVTLPDGVYWNKALQRVIEIFNNNKREGCEQLFKVLDEHIQLKKYETFAKPLLYNDLVLRKVISLVSQYRNCKLELIEKDLKREKTQAELDAEKQKEKIIQEKNQLVDQIDLFEIYPGVKKVAPILKRYIPREEAFNSKQPFSKVEIRFQDEQSRSQFISDFGIQNGAKMGKTKISQSPYLIISTDKFQGIFSAFRKKEILKSKYSPYVSVNESSRQHDSEVTTQVLGNALKEKYKDGQHGEYLKGDHLKSKILSDFYDSLEQAKTEQDVMEAVSLYKRDGRYQILATGQDKLTYLFKFSTSSVKAFEQMQSERIKAIILNDFKANIENAATPQQVNEIEKTFKKEGLYKALATDQNWIVNFFNLSPSVKSFEQLKNERLEKIKMG